MMKKTRVGIYVRVSTQEQAKEGYSIGEQTDRLKKFAEAHDWMIVNVYVDAGHSGADTNRPSLQEMLSDIRNGKLDKVLVYKLDRLSRSQKDTLTLIENEFLPHNTDFESMSEKLDTSTAQGRLFLGILAAFAQLEREVIKERMSMGINARVKEGKWRGGAAVPFGYDYESALEKLVINEYESMIVKFLFEKYNEGCSLRMIGNEMNEKGYSIGTNTKALRYMLRNKTYCGYLRHKGEWIQGLHDAIIDEGTYQKAVERLDESLKRFKESGTQTGTSSKTTNLGGLLYCAKCGARYGKAASGNAKYGIHYKYKCYSRHKKIKSMIKDPNCRNKIYSIEDLDNIIFNEIKKLAIDSDYIHQIKKESEKMDDVQKIHAIENQIKSINNQISRFMDLYGIGTYTMEELDAKTSPLQDQRKKLSIELESLQKNSNRITEPEVMKLVESFDDALENGNLYDRRTIIESLINRIDIDDEDITIHWNFI